MKLAVFRFQFLLLTDFVLEGYTLSKPCNENQLRKELTKYSRKIVQRRLVAGPGGNISVRCGNYILISPSGLSLDEIPPDEWVLVHLDTGETNSSARPSSEVNLHLALYRTREDVEAIVHTHAIYCIGLSSAGLTIPPMFADFVAIMGEVAYLDYIIPTTNELADAVAETIGTHHALVLRNHGAITVGGNLKEAYYRTEILEDAAQIYYLSLQCGKPRFLSEDECSAVLNLESERYRINLLKNSER